jgi:hypothetical protein
MARLHKFLPSDRIPLLYPSVGANRHLGTVTAIATLTNNDDVHADVKSLVGAADDLSSAVASIRHRELARCCAGGTERG